MDVVDGYDPWDPGELVGQRLAERYWIGAAAAIGPLASRFKAADLASGRDVCIEVRSVRISSAPGACEHSPAGVRHPNIADVYARGITSSGIEFVVLEPLEGELLSSRIAECGPLRAQEAVEIAASIGLALGALHARGLVHGALSASSVLLAQSPAGGREVKLVELLDTRPGDARVDVAALAALVHEMLTGSPASQAGSRPSRWTLARRSQRSSDAAQVPELERVTARALQGDFSSANELSSALWWGLAQAKAGGRVSSSGVSAPPPRVARSLGAGLLLGVIVLFCTIALCAVSGGAPPGIEW